MFSVSWGTKSLLLRLKGSAFQQEGAFLAGEFAR